MVVFVSDGERGDRQSDKRAEIGIQSQEIIPIKIRKRKRRKVRKDESRAYKNEKGERKDTGK